MMKSEAPSWYKESRHYLSPKKGSPMPKSIPPPDPPVFCEICGETPLANPVAEFVKTKLPNGLIQEIALCKGCRAEARVLREFARQLKYHGKEGSP